MLFNSVEYLIFFPIVVFAYFLTPHRFRWPVLLVASSIFYMAFKPEYILLCVVIILVDYAAGLAIANTKGFWRGFMLVVAILMTISLLFYYKYFNFANNSLAVLLGLVGVDYRPAALDVLLPIGLSFMTFQSLGYVIDVYGGKVKAERNLGVFSTFIMLFPQHIAGPIERAGHMLGQFRVEHRFSSARLFYGLRRMLWGYFKKMVVADQLSALVGQVYGAPGKADSVGFIVATLAFAVQIYCDFSGYSDIAVGSAASLGFELMENFERPYFSKSVGEFWRRWHISLSSWFRDYLYIPLGGSRKGKARTYINLMAVFLVSGLWHGAKWTFVLWGGLNGLLQIAGHLLKKPRVALGRALRLDRRPRLVKLLGIASTFFLVCLTWVFFRANSLHDAWYIFAHLIPTGMSADAVAASLHALNEGHRLLLVGLPVLLLVLVEYFGSRDSAPRRFFFAHRGVRYLCYLLLMVMILGLGVTDHEAQFIYFQF